MNVHVQFVNNPYRLGGVALAGPLLQLAAFAFGEPTPDAEALVVGQGVLEALGADVTTLADPLGLTGGAALLGEERLRVGLRAQGALLPLLLFGVIEELSENTQLIERALPPLHDVAPVCGYSMHRVRLLAFCTPRLADTTRRSQQRMTSM